MFERCLYFNTNHLARNIGKVWKEAFAELGLAPAHAYLLRLTIQQPGMVQKEIAEELRLEKSTITRFIDKMEYDGYLTRQNANSENQREIRIFPTTKAKDIGDRLEQIGNSLYQRMIDTLEESKLKDLVSNIRESANKL